MTSNHKKIARVWRLAQSNLKAARAAYRKEFDVSIDDRSINETIRRQFGYYRPITRAVAELPQEILLALLLRPGGGRRRGNQGKSLEARHAKAEMFLFVERRAPEIHAEAQAKGERKRMGQCKREAAREALKRDGVRAGMIPKNASEADLERVSATLLDQMKPSKRKRALGARKPGN